MLLYITLILTLLLDLSSAQLLSSTAGVDAVLAICFVCDGWCAVMYTSQLVRGSGCRVLCAPWLTMVGLAYYYYYYYYCSSSSCRHPVAYSTAVLGSLVDIKPPAVPPPADRDTPP